MQEFRVNDYITLKLINNKTIIYVKGEEFIQCRYLLLNKKVDELKDLISMESIDQLEAQLDKTMEMREAEQLNIPPETEFWAHCSNLQVWVEYYYNTKMLHRNLAFPLLKRLTEAGDPIAKKVFKEEIAQRFESGFESVVKFLIIQGYMEYFTNEELKIIGENCIILKKLDLSSWKFENFEELPEIIPKMINLQELRLNSCRLSRLPDSISDLRSLHTLSLGYNLFDDIPDSIVKLPKLETLQIYHNGLRSIPDNIGNMTQIQHLSLDENRIRSVPDSIILLKKLRFFDLSNNNIKTFPEILTKLNWLKKLDISGNQISELPDSIINLKALQFLDISRNNINHLPDSVGQMENLEYLWLEDNQIKTLPKSIYNMKSLKFIVLLGNSLNNPLDVKNKLIALGLEVRI